MQVAAPAGVGADDKAFSDNIKVCVRIRPPTPEEIADGDPICVHRGSSPDTLVLQQNSGRSAAIPYDWVLAGEDGQNRVYEDVGHTMVQGVTEGFHACAFAYGQTSSGKSHTIFGGPGEARGLLPRLTEGLFMELRLSSVDHLVKVSYLEIYNEQVRDLLTPGGASGSSAPSLEIRQHPDIGVFVEGLTHNVATEPQDVMRLVDFGHKIRVVGATNLNAASSRSHAVVTLHVERTVLDRGRRIRRAQLHAVDLAGSERLANAGAAHLRQRESKEINKSLSALSLMISKLASREQQLNRLGPIAASGVHIPCRSSKLTHLLSEALMGNCRTVLLACVAPVASKLAMTASTVHFASSAKKVRTRPHKNEELDGSLVEALRAEIEQLKENLNQIGGERKQDIVEKMLTAQLLHAHFSPTKEELKAQSQAFESRRNQVLENLGLSKAQLASLVSRGEVPKMREDADPYLVNVCEDPLLSGCLMYPLPRGRTVGVGSDPACAIHVEGLGIQPEMCCFENLDGVRVELTVGDGVDTPKLDGEVKKRSSLSKHGCGKVFVNNQLVTGQLTLHSKDRIRIGTTHVFQLNIPQDRRAQSVTGFVDKLVADTAVSSNRLAQEYANHLRDRIGKERTLMVLRALEHVQVLVDEANEMTEELRGGEPYELEFQAQVLADVASAAATPEVAVALYARERPEDLAPSGSWRFKSGGVGARELRCVFSAEEFRRRLEALRDVYEEVEAREEPWGRPGDSDPWSVSQSIPRITGGWAKAQPPSEVGLEGAESGEGLVPPSPRR